MQTRPSFYSLRTRILVSTTLLSTVFLGIAGTLLERAFKETVLHGVEDRLRGRVYMLIGAADFDASSLIDALKILPDPQLVLPGSGHYARIKAANSDGLWESPSLRGVTLQKGHTVATGDWWFGQIEPAGAGALFELDYGIRWEGDGDDPPQDFVIQTYESVQPSAAAVAQFRSRLWTWFVGLGLALLGAQALNLSRGLRPLQTVNKEVKAVERGLQEKIHGDYPSEIAGLTGSLNELIAHDLRRVKRYRDALGDLAHSIKTPLAIMQNQLAEQPKSAETLELKEQLERINSTVQYQLHRAAAAGSRRGQANISVLPVACRVVESLKKVYAERALAWKVTIPDTVFFPGDEGDLIEILGNLADNACKWARSKVAIEAARDLTGDGRERLRVLVRDDGAGIDPSQLERLMNRGVRLDESKEGHGIGLAIVREIVESSYSGTLAFESSERGTRVEAVIAW